MVLMSALAENLRDNLEFQLMTRPLLYADQILDANHDGLLSIKEVEAIMATPGENLAPLPVCRPCGEEQYDRPVPVALGHNLRPDGQHQHRG